MQKIYKQIVILVKGITLGDRTSGRLHIVWLQNLVVNKFAKNLQMSCNPCRGSWEVSKKVYGGWVVGGGWPVAF